MYENYDTWPDWINKLTYLDRPLTKKERNRLGRSLNKQGLYFFVNLRYPPDPCRYDPMLKKDLLDELKYPRYN